MSAVRSDPELLLPELPAPVPPLQLVDPELALAGRAGGGLLLLEGERTAARVRERGGVEELWMEGRRVASALELEAGVVVNMVASPAALRRERVVAGATLQETLLAPPRLPLLALQLGASVPPARGTAPERGGAGAPTDGASPPGTPGSRTEIPGSLVLLPDAASLRWRAAGGRLVAVDEDHPDRPVVVALSPGPGTLEADAAPGGGLRVRFTLPGLEPATLVVATGPSAESALSPLPHLAGHTRLAAASPREGVSTATGVAELDAGVDWARVRLASAARRTGPAARPWALFWSGVGALAAGDEDAAGAFLDHLEAWTGEERGAGPPHPLFLPAAPLPLLLAARHALALGDAGPALRQAGRLDPEALRGAPLDGGTALLWSLALDTLADGLRWSVGEEAAAGYRRLGAALPGRKGPAGGGASAAGLRLPMAGDPPAPAGGAADALARLLGSGGAPVGAVPEALAPWSALRSGRADEGYALWRSALARGMGEGPAGRGSWDAWRASPEAPETGLLLAGLVHGLLGWAPDAPVGRARLAPRLPRILTTFAVEGLRVGDVSLRLGYRREGDLHRFTLEPTAGRAPATVVFEPLLAISRLREARLDGKVVALDPREESGGLVVPAQLPLDAVRTVELTGPEGPG